MTLRTDFSDVRLFHSKFGLPKDDEELPMIMDSQIFEFRWKFLEEERTEYTTAYHNRNLVKAVDALIDFVYVAFGTALFMRAASPTPGAHPMHAEQWPSFERVKLYAQNRGYSIERAPRFLPYATNALMEKALFYDLKMFHSAHIARDALFSLEFLRRAASNAYLTAALMNTPWSACWEHVQVANMSKARAHPSGSDSKRASSWDVVKPSNWVTPDGYIQHELIQAGAIL